MVYKGSSAGGWFLSFLLTVVAVALVVTLAVWLLVIFVVVGFGWLCWQAWLGWREAGVLPPGTVLLRGREARAARKAERRLRRDERRLTGQAHDQKGRRTGVWW